MSARARSRLEPSFQDVQLEGGWPLSIGDPTRPLMIDSIDDSSIPVARAYFITSLIALLLASLFAPKNHFVDSIFRVRISNSTHVSRVYRFRFPDLSEKFKKIWLSVIVMRESAHGRDFENISVATDVCHWRGGSLVFQSTHTNSHLMLHYPPHSRTSYSHPVFRSLLTNTSTLDVNITMDFHSRSVHLVMFEWSLHNPANPVLLHYSFHCLCGAGLTLLALLLLKGRRRIEQMGTLINTVLFCLSCANLVFRSVLFLVIEKLMIAQLRMFLFYMIAFIANKDRFVLTKIGLVCLFICFLFDVGCCVRPWNDSLNLLHGHGIVIHLACFAVIGSVIAAMKSTADHLFSYSAYSTMLVLNFAGTIVTRDLAVVFPHFDHFMETEIGFYGIHLIIGTMLFYLHQGVSRTESEGDKLAEAYSDDEQGLI
jgi:hypothetical protein